MTELRLRFRDASAAVEDAVAEAQARLPGDWPVPELVGRVVVCPGLPEVVGVLRQEFLSRGLSALAARLVDNVRWG